MTGMLRRLKGGWKNGVCLALMLVTMLTASRTLAAEEPIRGVVTETMNSGGYTYLLLDRQGTKEWFAVPESLVRVGDEVQVQPGVQMGSYTSKTLGRTFDKIVFSGGISGMLKRVVKTADDQDAGQAAVKIAKAEGPNAYTVQEIFAKKDLLNGKPVVVRGKVVKASQYEGAQWLRLIDGTGSSKRGDHKLVVTSSQKADKDDVVVASGTVKTGKAFGALTYEVIVEDAKIEKEGK
jgi:hypothetical protein